MLIFKIYPAVKYVCWEGNHLRIVLTVNDSKAIGKSIVSELSAKLRKIGCRCVLDDGRKELCVARCPLRAPIAFVV